MLGTLVRKCAVEKEWGYDNLIYLKIWLKIHTIVLKNQTGLLQSEIYIRDKCDT